MVDTNLKDLTAAVERGDQAAAVKATAAAIEEQVDAQDILDAMTLAMNEVGRRFAAGEGVYIPEMLVSANAMKKATGLLEPLLAEAGVRPLHTAVIGTVRGDLHDIGKDLVAMMWKGADIEVIDLGVNVPPERFVEAAREHEADIVGISALLTTTMIAMGDVVEAFRHAGVEVPVVIGGAPVDEEYADRIGAAGYAKDAASAVVLAREILRPDPTPSVTAS